MDANSKYGALLEQILLYLCLIRVKGIAVHRDLVYSVLRLANQELTIVAKERIGALEDVIGSFESVAEITGSDLVGVTYNSPFPDGSQFKVIPSSHVTTESGTGLVHCAPAHGMEDYAAFQALGLIHPELLCHVDGTGQFSQEVASVTGEAIGKSLVGLDILKGGSKAMVKVLEDAGALVKLQKIKHRYPYDWKTGEPIIVMCGLIPNTIKLSNNFTGQLRNGSQTWKTSKGMPSVP